MATRRICFAVAAAISAMVMVGCGGKKQVSTTPATEITGNQRVVSARGELTRMANNDFSDHYFGIGTGTSSNESMAAEIAATNARGALATEMEANISARAKSSGLNSINGEAIETYMRRVIEGAQATIQGIRIRETITEFNRAENRYTVYTLVTVPMDNANQALRRQMANEQALLDAAAAKVLMSIIDSELDK